MKPRQVDDHMHSTAKATSIESIPPEIVAMILRQYIRAIDIHPGSCTSLPSVLSVCRLWRVLAQERADCWSMINIWVSTPDGEPRAFSRYGSSEAAALVTLLSKWLSMAQNHPVDISFWSFPYDSRQDVFEWGAITRKFATAPRFNTYWEMPGFCIPDLLLAFPQESFDTLTHLRLSHPRHQWHPDGPQTKITLPQLRVLCSPISLEHSLVCPILENFSITSNYIRSLTSLARTMQSFPTVQKLVLDSKEDFGIPEISRACISKCQSAFSSIRNLAVVSVARRKLRYLLPCFPSASTLTITGISSFTPTDTFDGSNFTELVILENSSTQNALRRAIPLEEYQEWIRFFNCLPRLRTLRIGRDMQPEDPRFKFYWPYHLIDFDNQRISTPRFSPAILGALALRKGGKSSLLPFRCSNLEHIHLTCVDLDVTFIEYLMDCLRLRHGSEDKAIKKTLISTVRCTSNIGSRPAFPDTSGLSYPEFEVVFNKHYTGSTMHSRLFGASRRDRLW